MIMKSSIKEFILRILKQQGDRTLIGFQAFEEFNELTKGDLKWTLNDAQGRDTNIIILSDITSECIKAFQEMLYDEIIEMKPTTFLVAMTERAVYDFEIAEKIKVYKKDKWLPMLIKKGKSFVED